MIKYAEVQIHDQILSTMPKVYFQDEHAKMPKVWNQQLMPKIPKAMYEV